MQFLQNRGRMKQCWVPMGLQLRFCNSLQFRIRSGNCFEGCGVPSSCVVMSGSECRTVKAAVCVILALVFLFIFYNKKCNEFQQLWGFGELTGRRSSSGQGASILKGITGCKLSCGWPGCFDALVQSWVLPKHLKMWPGYESKIGSNNHSQNLSYWLLIDVFWGSNNFQPYLTNVCPKVWRIERRRKLNLWILTLSFLNLFECFTVSF